MNDQNNKKANSGNAKTQPNSKGGVQQKDHPILKHFPKEKKNKSTLILVMASLVVVLAGIATGWMLSGNVLGESTSRGRESADGVAPGAQKSKTEAGLEDESHFSDQAEGILVEGGIDGEGTHTLERGSDPSKYVALFSTVIDLQSFVGKNVQVWGETVSAQDASWLMDVGKIKVVE